MSEHQQTISVTPIEHAFIVGETPQHPACFFLIVRFEGALDPECLESAYQTALGRHPMLTVVLQGDSGLPTRYLQWVPAPAAMTGGVLWNPLSLTPIDITRECGSRLAVRQRPDGVKELVFQFHHGVTDARGGIQFVEDVLAVYAGRSETLIALDSGLLAGRSDPKHEGVSHKLNVLRYLEQYAAHYIQKCAPLVSRTHATGEFNAALWPSHCQQTFETGEYRRLKSRTIQKGCTLNDLLMRDIMLAVGEWNSGLGVRQNVCLQMEINLRTVADARMPAALHGSQLNVSRSQHQMKDARQLLDSIRHETSQIKTNRLGYAMLLIAGVLARSKGGLRQLQKWQRPQQSAATAGIGNLGELFRYAQFGKARDGYLQVGELKIVDASYLPALKPGIKVSFGIATCMRRLNLTMHYDQTALSHDDARTVFEAVTARIRETAGRGAVKGEDLKALIQRHRDMSQRNPGFRSLPLGKHVATGVHIEMAEGRPGHGTVEQVH